MWFAKFRIVGCLATHTAISNWFDFFSNCLGKSNTKNYVIKNDLYNIWVKFLDYLLSDSKMSDVVAKLTITMKKWLHFMSK